MCSMKSLGVTAARFHFNFPNTTSSHSWRESERGRQRETEGQTQMRPRRGQDKIQENEEDSCEPTYNYIFTF